MRRRLTIALIGLVTVVSTACGGGGSITIGERADAPATDVADPGGTLPSETPEDSPSVAPGSPSDDPTQAPGAGAVPDGLEECTAVTGALTDLTGIISGEPLTDEERATIDEVRASMPDDVRADFDMLEDGYSSIAGGDMSDMMEASQQLASPEFMAALDRLTSYVTEICR